MCEPTTIAIASMAMTAASAGMSAMGQMNAQSAAGAQAGYMAQVARNNQAVAKMQAVDALARGQIDADKQRDVTSQMIGKQTALLAAEGTDGTGSEADILGDTAKAGELDAQTIKANATRQAWGYEAAGAGYGADAALKGSFQPSYLGAGASLLGGASSLADKWSRFKYSGGGLSNSGTGPSGYSGSTWGSGGDYGSSV